MPDGGFTPGRIAWAPQPGPQEALLRCPADEIFFGGARGGGKTSGAIGAWLDHAGRYGAAAQGIFFRRRVRDLEGVHAQCQKFFRPLGAYPKGKPIEWIFPNGAVLRLRHMWDERAADEYQGQEFTFLCFEELPQWPSPKPMDIMRATLRSATAVRKQIIGTGNPGGAGHLWVKARYITPARKGYRIIRDQAGGTRCFIPSKLADNKLLMEADPLYANRLRQLGSPMLVRAWLEGDWDVVLGGAFDDVWNPETQVVRPFVTPTGWRYRRALDWGFTKPASLGIWGIANGDPIPGRPELYIPRGSLVLMRELYTVQRNDFGEAIPNTGAEWDNERLGREIARISRPLKFDESVADPSIWIRQGGASINDQMERTAREAGDKWGFVRADNARIAGWQKLRIMMMQSAKPRPEGPGIYIMENNTEWLRTVPVLQRDLKDPDDVDTEQEDHAADMTRYCVMAKSGVRLGPGVAAIGVPY